jgi:stage II sporulation protein GA (sporulation sigma-E factor processing peptidase)
MKIYLDLVLITNFFIDFILLYGTSKILKKYITLKRLLLGSFIGALSIFLLFINLNTLELTILKILLSVLIIISTFGLKDLKKNIIYFYILSIILGGTLYLLDITKLTNKNTMFIKNPYIFNFILLLLITPIIVFKYLKEYKYHKEIISNKYIIEININDKKYTLDAILDTGNRLKDPYKKRPIILVDKDIKNTKKRPIYVPYKALNTNGVIKCILPDKVIINNKEFKNCLIGLSNDKFSLNGVSCILPNTFKEDL